MTTTFFGYNPTENTWKIIYIPRAEWIQGGTTASFTWPGNWKTSCATSCSTRLYFFWGPTCWEPPKVSALYEEPLFRPLLFLISPLYPIKHVVMRPLRARLHWGIPQSFFKTCFYSAVHGKGKSVRKALWPHSTHLYLSSVGVNDGLRIEKVATEEARWLNTSKMSAFTSCYRL